MNNYSNLSARILNRPLLVEPGYARVFFSALASRLGIVQLEDVGGEVLTPEGMQGAAAEFKAAHGSAEKRYRPYQVYEGVAVLPVSGSLVHKSGNLRPYSGSTGYDGIIARAADAFNDPEIKGVLLDNDTPGGEVAGCFDTSHALRKMADAAGKPLWTLCYDMNCSAGMALASAAHRRLITQTGVAGSVGVVMAHANQKKRLDKNGVAVTLIHSGAHKVAGNPYESLSKKVLAGFQESTDQLRLEFAQLMAGHMNMSVEAILATEAATYRGQAAVDIGFADELINGHEAIQYFADHLASNDRVTTLGTGSSMEVNEGLVTQAQGGAPAVAGQQPAAQQPEQAPVAQQSAANTPVDAGAAMQARIAGIMGLEGAAANQATANHLAFNTQLTVEQAAGVLATLPGPGTTDQMNTALDKVMASEPQPNVGADLSGDAGGSGEQPAGDVLLASYEKATGDK